MTNDPIGVVPVLAVVYVTVVSIPVSILTVTLSEFTESMANALGFVVGGMAAVTALGILALGLVMGPSVAGGFVATLLTAALVLGAIPVGLGWVVLTRIRGLQSDPALRDALTGWPIGLLASLVLLSSPEWSGFDYRVATGPWPWVLLGTVFLLAESGPTIVGLAVSTVRARQADGDRS